MTSKYDFLIVGCGLYGATFARQVTDRGKTCLIIDKREHIGGNVYTKKQHGIDVHIYGPHIFHTNSENIWNYVQQFAKFNTYRHRVKSCYDDKLYSFPINLNTLEELWGGSDDNYLLHKLLHQKTECDHGANLEQWAISQVGEEIYRKFIYGYTKKQWGKEPSELPSSIIKRIPIRTNRNDDYHKHKFSGLPISGYTHMVTNMLDEIPYVLNVNYFDRRDYWDSLAKTVVYTGGIDEFFNYEHGELDWRSLRFETKVYDSDWVQPVAQINYPQDNVNWTRTVEHKHFSPKDCKKTVVTTEYPKKYNRHSEKYYPLNDDKNTELYQKYKRLIPANFVFGGRLAEYKYYDMHQVIASSLQKAKKIIDLH